jgi:hypothetical protein
LTEPDYLLFGNILKLILEYGPKRGTPEYNDLFLKIDEEIKAEQERVIKELKELADSYQHLDRYMPYIIGIVKRMYSEGTFKSKTID